MSTKHSKAAHCLHLLPWSWGQCIPPNCWYQTYQNTKMSNL